jgi:hypothetical protein
MVEGTPDASINGGQSTTKNSAAELFGGCLLQMLALFGPKQCDGRIG